MRELITVFSKAGQSGATGIVLAGNGPVFSAGHDFGCRADHALIPDPESYYVATIRQDFSGITGRPIT